MNQRSSERIPASSLIILSSVVFTITTYLIFAHLWGVPIPIELLLSVLGLQLGALLLGSSKILTRLGAAALSALVSIAAVIAAVILLFPPPPAIRIAGAVGAGAALIFILASFVAASRGDPVVSDDPEMMVLGELDEVHEAELIKYGEIRDDDFVVSAPLEPTSPRGTDGGPDTGPDLTDDHPPPMPEEGTYEFDVPARNGRDLTDSAGVSDPYPEFLDIEGSTPFDEVEETGSFRDRLGSEPFSLTDLPGSGEGDTALSGLSEGPVMTRPGRRYGETPGNAADPGTEAPASDRFPGFRMRSRYKIIDAASGEHFGTCYGDEGYSTLDNASLSGLLGDRDGAGEWSIVRLDWSNFDEVEVHVRRETDPPVVDEPAPPGGSAETDIVRTGRDTDLPAPPPETPGASPETPPGEGPQGEGEGSVPGSSGPRYVIYDRRTIQPMMEFEPGGDRPRIDRLVLYKMFPDYDFKTFEIDSIRWEGDEVRILVRGEKKNPRTGARGPVK